MPDYTKATDEELRDALTPPQFRPPKRSRSYRDLGPLTVPAVKEHFTTRPHRFKCPRCNRVFIGIYKPEKPLPVCMGGGPAGLHPRFLLVSEVKDEWDHMWARIRRGDPVGRPIIQPQNAHQFEVQTPGEDVRDLGPWRAAR